MTLTGTFTAKRFETVEMQMLDKTFGGYAERVLRAEILERAIIPLLSTGKEYVIHFGKMLDEVRVEKSEAWPFRTRSMTVTVRLALAFDAEVGDEIDRNGVPLDCTQWYLDYFLPHYRRAMRQRLVPAYVENTEMPLMVEAFSSRWYSAGGAYTLVPVMDEVSGDLLAWRRVA